MPHADLRDAPSLPPRLRFLAGGGAATRLILDRDWSAHPLGEPSGWPEGLKATLSTVLNSPESMILCWGREELSFFFNETYFPLLGPRLPWAMGAPFREVWADAWEQARPIIADAFAGRSRRFDDLPWKLATDRGAADTWFTFSYSRILDAEGEIAGLFIFTNETTARVLADRALARSQDALRALNETLERRVEERTAERDRLWDTSPDLLLVVSTDGIYQRVNRAWTEVLGYAADEIVGQEATFIVHPDDVAATRAALGRAREDTLSNFENRFRHRDGSYRWIQWSAAPGSGAISAIGRDVTAAKESGALLRQAEDALRQAQKVETVGQITGGLAHDFNNFLTVIRGSVELLRRPGLPEERRTRYIEAIGDTAHRAARLTNQLLAFARRQALTPEVTDVGESVRSLRDMLGTLSGARVTVAIRAEGPPCRVHVDRNQFDAAIINMAANARDAMHGEGVLTVGVRHVPGMPAIRTHPARTGDFVAISLSDTGEGIPPDRIDHIFEPFFTTKDVGEGTGLGLSQVFGFAKQSGGEVTVESEVGRGTTFTIYLPRATGEPAATPAAAAPEREGPPDGARVLLVEDNAEVGEFARSALAELGYAAVLARDAAGALGALATGDRFDVVFSDVVMPGITGLELGAEIRRLYPDLPVVLSSGYSSVLAQEGSHGFDLIHKPYSVEQLSKVLRKAVGTRRRRAAGA